MSTTIAPAFDGKTILIKTRPAPERFNSVHRSKTTVWALGGSEFTTERGDAARLAVHIYTSHDRNRRVYRSKTIRVTEELRGVERFLMFDEPSPLQAVEVPAGARYSRKALEEAHAEFLASAHAFLDDLAAWAYNQDRSI